MKKNMLSAAVVFSLGIISMSANAANINFSGEVVSQTCTLAEGTDFDMKMSPVGVSDVLAANAAAAGGVTALTAAVTCKDGGAAGIVTMALMPIPGSTEGKILKNKDGDATGVGFIVVGNDNNAIDFDVAGKSIITAPMVDGAANIRIAATYALDGSEVKAGTVSAVLPFMMTYK